MSYFIVSGASVIVGIVLGALIFRNNEKKADQVIAGAQTVASDVSKAATTVAADAKKV